MGRQNTTVTESLVVHGSSSIAVIARVQAAFERMQEYVLTAPADDVLQVARSAGRRARRAEFCTIRTIQEPQRLVVTLSGHLGSGAMDVVREAVRGSSAEHSGGPAVESFRPSTPSSTSASFVPPTDWFVTPDTGPVAESRSMSQAPAGNLLPPPTVVPVVADIAHDTVLRSSGRPLTGVPTARRQALVRVGDGANQMLSDVLLIGRAPEPRPSDPSHAKTLEVADAAMSKTHLALGRSGDDIWIEDRNSSNGTQWNDATGIERALIPEVRVVVDVPCRITAGDTVISIGWDV